MNPNNKSALIMIALTVALTMVGCNRKTIYSHYEHTPINGWEKNDTLKFSIFPVRTDGLYREEVGLRINSAYPFMGLTLIVEQHTTQKRLMRSDTLHTSLIDHDGTIQGEGMSYYQYNFHLANLQLQADDTLLVNIRHNMKREMLPGISDIGVTLKRLSED